MYSKELEELIEGALADGVITDKERSVLHKKAEAEGVDPDELDMVLDGRLAKMKTTPPPQPVQSNKVGNVMKCPSCGAPYEPGTGKCSVCGHVFQNIEAVKSSVKLAEGIQKMMGMAGKKAFKDQVSEADISKIGNYISTFPLPNAKDDLLDFILNLDTKRKANDYMDLVSAYDTKYREAVNKARVIFPGDPQLEQAIAMTDKGYTSPNKRLLIIAGVCLGVVMVLMLLLALIGLAL